MTEEVLYDITSSFLVFIVGVIFAYLSVKLKDNLRKLSIAFAVFVFIHGTYHLSRILEYEFVADNILEPVSVAALIVFGLIFFKIKKRKMEIVNDRSS